MDRAVTQGVTMDRLTVEVDVILNRVQQQRIEVLEQVINKGAKQ